jgi:hypothetical protein
MQLSSVCQTNGSSRPRGKLQTVFLRVDPGGCPVLLRPDLVEDNTQTLRWHHIITPLSVP